MDGTESYNMELTLHRVRFYDTRTTGQLYVDGDYFCFTLEDKMREVAGQPVATWKVQNETAIPVGKYKVTLENSPRFGIDTLTVNNVPGYSGIRMHPGNTEGDTDGCLILGYKITDQGLIVPGTTRTAVADLKQKVKEGLASGEVWITIDNVM